MSEWLPLPISAGYWPRVGSPPPQSMASHCMFSIDISKAGVWPQRAMNKAMPAWWESDPLTWALPRIYNSRQSDPASHFHSHGTRCPHASFSLEYHRFKTLKWRQALLFPHFDLWSIPNYRRHVTFKKTQLRSPAENKAKGAASDTSDSGCT